MAISSERLFPDGGVAWAWNELTHIPVSDIDPAVDASGPAVDAYHSSSIEIMDGGDYLIGLRNMSEAVRIRPDSGSVVWVLGGPRSNFTFPNDPQGGFRFPNGVRELANGHIVLVDHGDPVTAPPTRAVEYALNTDAGTATLVWSAEAFTSHFGERLRLRPTPDQRRYPGVLRERRAE